MKILTQNEDNIQAIGKKVLKETPFALRTDKGEIYILIKDLPDEMKSFIDGEPFEGEELHVFSEAYEERVTRRWRGHGYERTYRRQSMEYMGRTVTIKYLHVINPETKVGVSLIPWFMLPKRRYPVTTYIFAAWYSTLPEEKAGVRKTGEVVRELFRLNTFDPSTVWRACAQISRIFGEQVENDGPLSIQEPKIATTAAIMDRVNEFLEKCTSAETIEDNKNRGTDEFKAQPRPAAAENAVQENEDQEGAGQDKNSSNHVGNTNTATANRADAVSARILGNIPVELAKVTRPEPVKQSKQDRRDRPARPRGERLPKEPEGSLLIESGELKKKRDELTMVCMNMVLNAVCLYHKFLI